MVAVAFAFALLHLALLLLCFVSFCSCFAAFHFACALLRVTLLLTPALFPPSRGVIVIVRVGNRNGLLQSLGKWIVQGLSCDLHVFQGARTWFVGLHLSKKTSQTTSIKTHYDSCDSSHFQTYLQVQFETIYGPVHTKWRSGAVQTSVSTVPCQYLLPKVPPGGRGGKHGRQLSREIRPPKSEEISPEVGKQIPTQLWKCPLLGCRCF